MEFIRKRIRLFTGIIIFILSAFVYGQFGFNGELTRDEAIYMYSGQQFAKGIAPYESIFDHKGPLSPLIAGVGVVISHWLRMDDLLIVRIIFYLICCLSAVAMYFLAAYLFSSTRIGWFTLATFYGFWEYGSKSMSGPRAKVPMVLFEILSVYYIAKKRWIRAGFWCAITTLVWQPTGLFGVVAMILAFVQTENKNKRLRNVGRVILGGIIPILCVSAYFIYKGAFFKFIDGFIIFNIIHIQRIDSSFWHHIQYPFSMVIQGYILLFLPILISFVMFGFLFSLRVNLQGNSVWKMICNDRFAVVLLTCPAYIIWSFFDFQGSPDFFVLIPYSAIGFAWFIELAVIGLDQRRGCSTTDIASKCTVVLCLLLIGSATLFYRFWANSKLPIQRRQAQFIQERYAPDNKIVSIGIPEILVLLHLDNSNPYLFIINGVDNNIDARVTGGFYGWMDALKIYDPEVIGLGNVMGHYKEDLLTWLDQNYHRKRFGRWKIYVKSDNLIDIRDK